MIVTVSRGLRYDPTDDLAAVRAVVPRHWWRYLEAIRFARLRPPFEGYYEGGTVTLNCCGRYWRDTIRRTLVHELAHHADRFGVLSAPLARERRRFRRLHYRATNPGEYVARGAEEFFAGDRRSLRRWHPALWRALRREAIAGAA